MLNSNLLILVLAMVFLVLLQLLAWIASIALQHVQSTLHQKEIDRLQLMSEESFREWLREMVVSGSKLEQEMQSKK